ncbi:putative Major facilitator superfamily domain-containing protein [Seiridium unicorne]|uniref:Major facilitator superfamily domain-containing protein n=1 Tax=Seiridium unicorne TaxID=138068 RepID=A0ABR2UJ01_9PEZI
MEVNVFDAPIAFIVERSKWRWVFCINLPINGISMILLLLFLRVKYDRTTTLMARMKRMDYLDNSMLISAFTSVLIVVSYGGARYALV